MPTATNKQRVLSQLFTAVKKEYDPPEPSERPVLEQLLYALCREDATREQADQAFRNLQERFFDWNEVRVSSIREIEEAVTDLSHAEGRAQRVIQLLQEVFEANFSFDLDPLQKAGVKQAAKKLSRYQALNDFAIAWVIQQALGGHAIPLDSSTLRVLRRLGILEEGQGQENLEAIRASLEHVVPKARGTLFNELVSFIAHEYCTERNPNCADCPLAQDCPSARAGAESGAGGERTARKPR
jgi:endonuclease-3